MLVRRMAKANASESINPATAMSGSNQSITVSCDDEGRPLAVEAEC